MRIKKNNGLTSIDLVIAIIAITLFSTLIFSLMSYNVNENVKLTKETMAIIHLTEILENIGIESYENLSNGNHIDLGVNQYDEHIEGLVPDKVKENYKVDIFISDELNNVAENENIMKKIQVTLTYEVNNKQYAYSMQRMKMNS